MAKYKLSVQRVWNMQGHDSDVSQCPHWFLTTRALWLSFLHYEDVHRQSKHNPSNYHTKPFPTQPSFCLITVVELLYFWKVYYLFLPNHSVCLCVSLYVMITFVMRWKDLTTVGLISFTITQRCNSSQNDPNPDHHPDKTACLPITSKLISGLKPNFNSIPLDQGKNILIAVFKDPLVNQYSMIIFTIIEQTQNSSLTWDSLYWR